MSRGGRPGDRLATAPQAKKQAADPGARLRRAQEIGGALPFEWDAATDRVLASAGYRALFGLGTVEDPRLDVFLTCVHPDDRDSLEDERRRLMEAPTPFELTYRVVLPGGITRWLLSRGASLADDAGAVTGIAGVSMDITNRKEMENELRRSRREAHSRFRELRGLYQNAPVGLALLDRDLHYLRVNDFLARMNGIAPEAHIGRRIDDVLPEFAAHEILLRQAIAAKEPVRDLDVETATAGDPRRTTAFRLHCYPLYDERGALSGIGVVAQDVTAQKRAERAQELLSRELNHRIKNLFAVIGSIVTLSARGHGGLVAFGRTVRGRIEALAKAHDLARRDEDGTGVSGVPSLQALLRTLLAPYRSDENRPDAVRIVGDDLPLGPHAATALALAFHELATNAAKYGALSTVTGQLSLACALGDDSLSLAWTERGGPAVLAEPGNTGFGSLLTHRSLVRDLGGEMHAEWRSSGLALRVVLPRAALAR